jgi:hypothetical protein
VNGSRKMDEEEERDAVFYRLEMLGYRVGQGLVERYHLPLSPHIRSLRKRKLMVGVFTQVLQRSPPLHRHPGRNKVPVQRPLDARL